MKVYYSEFEYSSERIDGKNKILKTIEIVSVTKELILKGFRDPHKQSIPIEGFCFEKKSSGSLWYQLDLGKYFHQEMNPAFSKYFRWHDTFPLAEFQHFKTPKLKLVFTKSKPSDIYKLKLLNLDEFPNYNNSKYSPDGWVSTKKFESIPFSGVDLVDTIIEKDVFNKYRENENDLLKTEYVRKRTALKDQQIDFIKNFIAVFKFLKSGGYRKISTLYHNKHSKSHELSTLNSTIQYLLSVAKSEYKNIVVCELSTKVYTKLKQMPDRHCHLIQEDLSDLMCPDKPYYWFREDFRFRDLMKLHRFDHWLLEDFSDIFNPIHFLLLKISKIEKPNEMSEQSKRSCLESMTSEFEGVITDLLAFHSDFLKKVRIVQLDEKQDSELETEGRKEQDSKIDMEDRRKKLEKGVSDYSNRLESILNDIKDVPFTDFNGSESIFNQIKFYFFKLLKDSSNERISAEQDFFDGMKTIMREFLFEKKPSLSWLPGSNRSVDIILDLVTDFYSRVREELERHHVDFAHPFFKQKSLIRSFQELVRTLLGNIFRVRHYSFKFDDASRHGYDDISNNNLPAFSIIGSVMDEVVRIVNLGPTATEPSVPKDPIFDTFTTRLWKQIIVDNKSFWDASQSAYLKLGQELNLDMLPKIDDLRKENDFKFYLDILINLKEKSGMEEKTLLMNWGKSCFETFKYIFEKKLKIAAREMHVREKRVKYVNMILEVIKREFHGFIDKENILPKIQRLGYLVKTILEITLNKKYLQRIAECFELLLRLRKLMENY